LDPVCEGTEGEMLRPPWVTQLKGQQIGQQNEYYT